MLHRQLEGRQTKKFDDGLVASVIRAHKDGRTLAQLTVLFPEISRSQLYRITKGMTRADIEVEHEEQPASEDTVQPKNSYAALQAGRREHSQVGANSVRAALTQEQVTALRKDLKTGDYSVPLLQKKYGLSRSGVRNVATGRRYRNVPGSVSDEAYNLILQENKRRRMGRPPRPVEVAWTSNS